MSSTKFKSWLKTFMTGFAIILATLMPAMAQKGPEKEGGEPEMTSGLDVIGDREIALVPGWAKCKWPTRDQINGNILQIKGTVIEKILLESLQTVIRKDALPSDVSERFLPLKRFVCGCDANMVRYKSGNFSVQITQTSARMEIFLRPDLGASHKTKDGMVSMVNNAIGLFLNEADEILKTQFQLVEEKGGALAAKNPTLYKGETRDKLQSWTQTLEWWTNGDLIFLSLYPNPGSSSAYVDQPDWLSVDAANRMKGKKE